MWSVNASDFILETCTSKHTACGFKHKIKVKVKLSLCLTKHHAIKTQWGSGCKSTHSLTSALDGGEWLASRPGRYTPRERAPDIHWIGGWEGPTDDLFIYLLRSCAYLLFCCCCCRRRRRHHHHHHHHHTHLHFAPRSRMRGATPAWCLVKHRGNFYLYYYYYYSSAVSLVFLQISVS
jgi:hypothetical protein